MKPSHGSLYEINLIRVMIKKSLNPGNIHGYPFPPSNLYELKVRNLLQLFVFRSSYILEDRGVLRLTWSLLFFGTHCIPFKIIIHIHLFIGRFSPLIKECRCWNVDKWLQGFVFFLSFFFHYCKGLSI